MIIERVEIALKPGHEDEYLQAMEDARGLLAGAKGCELVIFGRGIENPSKALLLVEWDAIESHAAFKKTPEHAELVNKVGGFVAGAMVDHFSCVDNGKSMFARR